MLAPSDASRNRTLPGYGRLLEIRRCQVGSDGCSLHRMLLDTGSYRVGKDGGSPQMVARGFLQLEPSDSVNPATRIPSTSPPASSNHAYSVHPETRIHSTSPPGSFNPGHADSLNRNPRHDSFNPHRLLCSTHHADSLHAKTHSTTDTRSLVPRPPRTSMPRPPQTF